MREILLVLALACAGLSAQQSPRDVVDAFAPCDLDGDGRAEVKTAKVADEAGKATDPLVVVLVEGRVWRWRAEPRFDQSIIQPTLADAVHQYALDVADGGFHTLVVVADVHRGPPHQDGRTVLALRRLLQRLRANGPLAGAVLVGHFPDALLVRTCNWRRNEKLELPGIDGKPVAIDEHTTNVRCVPEIVAHRCDVVLADLDGDWERVYVPGPATLRSVWGWFGDAVPERGGVCRALQLGELTVTDVFHVRDGAAIADQEAFTLQLDPDDRDHECSADDRTRGNPLARPDINVSRLDARGVAWVEPKPGTFEFDAGYEQQLLVGYFGRNHAFRSAGVAADHRRPASISHGLGSGMGALRAADPAWAMFDEPGYDVHEHADLLALCRWLRLPAVLRTIRVHSDPWGGAFAATDPDTLQKAMVSAQPEAGGVAAESGAVPAVPDCKRFRNGRADFTFFHLLAEHGVTGDPFLLIHTGCEVVSPPGAVEHAYDDPEYGKCGQAESMLFFTPCLAMVGRAKVFYDEPRGFSEALGEGKTFGDAWRRYFEVESQAQNWNEAGGDIGRKRAYFWSVLGDWTLRLPK